MTQYPYAPPAYPNYYGQHPQGEDLLAPARRAGILMFILGGLGMLCGACAGVMAVVPWEQFAGPETAQLQEMIGQLGISIHVVFIIVAVMLLVPSLAFIILGLFVRRGGLGAVVTGIVLTSLALLWGVFNVMAGAGGIRAAGGFGWQRHASALCAPVIPLALLVLLLVLLIQAARNAGSVKAMAQQQQAYWQYQQQQYYQQGMYQQPPPGQAPMPPPPPQTPPMPPPPTFDNSGGPNAPPAAR